MADTTRNNDAGRAGADEDAAGKTPRTEVRNVGAGRAGSAGTVADDDMRAERQAGSDPAVRSGGGAGDGADDQPAGADIDNDRRPILGSGTIGVGAGGAADRPPTPTDAAPAYVSRDVNGAGKGNGGGDDRSAGDGAGGSSAGGSAADAGIGRDQAATRGSGSLAAASGEEPTGDGDAAYGTDKPGILSSLKDTHPGS